MTAHHLGILGHDAMFFEQRMLRWCSAPPYFRSISSTHVCEVEGLQSAIIQCPTRLASKDIKYTESQHTHTHWASNQPQTMEVLTPTEMIPGSTLSKVPNIINIQHVSSHPQLYLLSPGK